jgi:hypothetical protein
MSWFIPPGEYRVALKLVNSTRYKMTQGYVHSNQDTAGFTHEHSAKCLCVRCICIHMHVHRHAYVDKTLMMEEEVIFVFFFILLVVARIICYFYNQKKLILFLILYILLWVHTSHKDRKRKVGLVAHTCHPSTWEAEAGGSRVPGQPGLPREALAQKNKCWVCSSVV